MKRKIAWIARCLLCIIIACFLFYTDGFAGFIDFSQLAEVFLTAFVLSIVIRVFKRRGLFYIMEWTSLLAGILWMLIHIFLMWMRYDTLEGIMVRISGLSFWYGLLLSVCSSWLLQLHTKNKEKECAAYE